MRMIVDRLKHIQNIINMIEIIINLYLIDILRACNKKTIHDVTHQHLQCLYETLCEINWKHAFLKHINKFP